MQALLERYARIDFYDEFSDDVGVPRSHYVGLASTLRSIDWSDFQHRVATVNAVRLQRGVAFTEYADACGTERLLPFDLRPRIAPADEWSLVERGITQRVYALNAFLTDVYGKQRILADGVCSWDHHRRPSSGKNSGSRLKPHRANSSLSRSSHCRVIRRSWATASRHIDLRPYVLHGPGDRRAGLRAHARCLAGGFAGGEFVARWRRQRNVDPRVTATRPRFVRET
jgi:uncharacterized circularly permuted ATP-grasp superfamily protein